MASLGTLPDEVLLEIITAMGEEAHRRSNWIPPDPAEDPSADPAAATSAVAATTATAATSPMERITDDALLQV